MAYKRKTIDRWDIETNYGYGWEVENSETQGKMQYVLSRNTERTCRYMENAVFA